MFVNQAIQRPVGINVFGSHQIQVEPNRAKIVCAVSRVETEASGAFAEARKGAESVRAYVESRGIPASAVQSSKMSLTTDVRRNAEGADERGYRAMMRFEVVLDDVDQLEEVLAGVVEAGANQVSSTNLETTELAEHRKTARREAFAAARRKAELYAEEAGLALGPAVHIEDLDPERLPEQRRGHAAFEGSPAATIEVAGAVMVSFAIEPLKSDTGFG